MGQNGNGSASNTKEKRVTSSIPRYTRKGVQRDFTIWPYQKEALFKTPHLTRENLKHLLGLTERDQVVSPLYSENGEESVLEDRNIQVFTHQFKDPHEDVRIGVNLGRRQLGPTKHLPLEIRERESKTHVFENHLIQRKDMILILRTHSNRCARKYHLPIFRSPNRTERNFTRTTLGEY